MYVVQCILPDHGLQCSPVIAWQEVEKILHVDTVRPFLFFLLSISKNVNAYVIVKKILTVNKWESDSDH